MRLGRLLAACLWAASAAGCATSRPDSYCLIAEPIRPTLADVDVISEPLTDAIYRHNCRYQAVCGDIGMECD